MDHKRIALYVQMLAWRTGRAWPEAIRALMQQGLLQNHLGVADPVESINFNKTLIEVEAEYLAFVATHPNLAPLALPADRDPNKPVPKRTLF